MVFTSSLYNTIAGFPRAAASVAVPVVMQMSFLQETITLQKSTRDSVFRKFLKLKIGIVLLRGDI